MNPHGVAYLRADHGTRQLAVERPHLLREALRNGHLPLFDDELDLDQVTAARCSARQECDPLTLTAGGCAWIAQFIRRRTGIGLDRDGRRATVPATVGGRLRLCRRRARCSHGARHPGISVTRDGTQERQTLVWHRELELDLFARIRNHLDPVVEGDVMHEGAVIDEHRRVCARLDHQFRWSEQQITCNELDRVAGRVLRTFSARGRGGTFACVG
jgi:hypothetical protein